MQKTLRGCGVIRNVSPFEGEVLGADPSVLTKQCSKCKQVRKITEFWPNRSRKDKLGSYCKSCNRLACHEHHKANKAAYRAKNKRNKEALLQLDLEYLKTHPCTICGEADPVVLEYHHTEEKTGSVAKLKANRSARKYLAERNKCVVVCANCHRRLTAKQFNWTKS